MDPQTPKQPIRQSDSPPPLIKRFSSSFQRHKTFQAANYLPGDFIKPDPNFTRNEVRKHILKELETCLNNLTILEDEHIEDDSYLSYCSNPRERLYHITQMLEELNIDEEPANKAYQILVKYLSREQIDYNDNPVKLVHLVLGFVHTDLLPCGRTIYSYWNNSPFTKLRNAQPLSDEEQEQEQEQEQNNEEDVKPTDYVVTVNCTLPSLLLTLAFITLWIAITAGQLVPVRVRYA